MLPNVGFPELILILALALIIFGPGKLPEVGRALGKSVKEFKKATSDIKEQLSDENDGLNGQKPSPKE
ncbi:MAG: twin-arginine translocase TatA/TatE family subunit [Peptococcaceae bacterium]